LTLDSTADGILVTDDKGKVLTYNQRFADMWRIPTDLMAGADDRSIVAFVVNQLSHPNSFIRTIESLYADFNSLVKKGQVLARLDPSLFQTQIEQARANLIRSQADLERLRVSLDDAKTRSQIPAFVSKYQIGFPVWYGATGEDLAKLNLGEAVPDTVFIDQEGRIVARVMGQMRKNELKERLDWLTGDRTSPAPQPVVKHLEK